jgi:F420-dependent oxidoreductase-like protein
MRLSVGVTNFSWPGGAPRLGQELVRVARQADDGGLDTLWVADHLLQMEPGTDPADPMLEAYTTLGYLAAATSRVRLGTMVSAATWRAPAMLIKAVTTVDVLSGGRAWLGVGAGYQAEEAGMLGLPLPPTAERFEQLADILELAKRMWSDDESPFAGRQVHASRPIGSPAPLSGPHPPILVGGTGEKRTLRLVAEHAQACNLFDIPDGGVTLRRKLEVLAGHCADVGRPLSDIDKTVSTRLGADESPAEFAQRCAALAAFGMDHTVAITTGAWTEEALGRLCAAVPLVAGL